MCALIALNNIAHGKREHPDSGWYRQDNFTVLVEHVHIVKDQQWGIERIRSLVRLKSFYERASAEIRDSLYFSFISGNAVSIDGLFVEDGEVDSSNVVPTILRAGELPSNMIEARAQVVNDLTRKYTESERDNTILMVLDSLKEQLFVMLRENGVFAFLKERLHFGFEIMDSLV